MVIGPDYSREMRAGEEDAVDALLRAAFDSGAEAALVRKLRKARVIAGEMVLPMEGGIVGYYALSRMVAPKRWLCLAPVAIAPEVQGRGYGRRMIGLLGEWARISKTPVVVVGAPDFYGRAGFSHAAAAKLNSPYGVENTLLAGVEGVPEVDLTYPAAFDGL